MWNIDKTPASLQHVNNLHSISLFVCLCTLCKTLRKWFTTGNLHENESETFKTVTGKYMFLPNVNRVDMNWFVLFNFYTSCAAAAKLGEHEPLLISSSIYWWVMYALIHPWTGRDPVPFTFSASGRVRWGRKNICVWDVCAQVSL